MKYCRGSYSIILLLVLTVCSAIFPQRVFGYEAVSLPAPQYSQHLPVPDANGDTGYYNCAIAASAMALQAIYGAADQPDISYAAVRAKTRLVFPNVQKGITLQEAASIVPMLTGQELDAAFIAIDPSRWQEEVRRKIKAGYPLVAHISDWSYLWNHEGKNKSAHAILITGINETSVQYIDPWNGYRYSVPHSMFVSAWSQGYYSWHAMVFIPKNVDALAGNFAQ